MEIKGNYEYPRENHSLAESLTQKGESSSSDDNNDSYQDTSTDETLRSFSSES